MSFLSNYSGRNFLGEVPESPYYTDGRMARTKEEEKEEEVPQTEIPPASPLMNVLSGAGLATGLRSLFGGGGNTFNQTAPAGAPATPTIINGTPAVPWYSTPMDIAGGVGTAYNLYNAVAGKNLSQPTDAGGVAGALGGGAAGYAIGGAPGAAIGSYVGKPIGRDIGTAFDDDRRLSKKDRKIYGGLGVSGLVGNPLGIGAAGLLAVDKLSQVFGSGKSGQQKERDQYRGAMKDIGMLDKDYMLKMEGGQQYNLGRERDPAYGFRTYETRQDRPFQGAVIGFVNPLAYILTGGNEFTPQLANKLANAASNTANDLRAAYRNVLEIYARAGISPDDARAAINQLAESGKIDEHTKNVFNDTIDQLSGGRDPNLDDTWAAAQPKPESWEMTDARKKQEKERAG